MSIDTPGPPGARCASALRNSATMRLFSESFRSFSRRTAVYDRFPSIASGTSDECLAGWTAIGKSLSQQVGSHGTVVVECYPGVHAEEIRSALQRSIPAARFLCTESLLR